MVVSALVFGCGCICTSSPSAMLPPSTSMILALGRVSSATFALSVPPSLCRLWDACPLSPVPLCLFLLCPVSKFLTWSASFCMSSQQVFLYVQSACFCMNKSSVSFRHLQVLLSFSIDCKWSVRYRKMSMFSPVMVCISCQGAVHALSEVSTSCTYSSFLF